MGHGSGFGLTHNAQLICFFLFCSSVWLFQSLRLALLCSNAMIIGFLFCCGKGSSMSNCFLWIRNLINSAEKLGDFHSECVRDSSKCCLCVTESKSKAHQSLTFHHSRCFLPSKTFHFHWHFTCVTCMATPINGRGKWVIAKLFK